MAERTGIAWTDHTWNPWMGCTKVSPGCAHCYMYREQKQYGRNPELVVRSKTTFLHPLRWHTAARVFTCSWSDFFHEAADAWRADAWAIIRATPHLTYQILTKRVENIPARLPEDWGAGWPNVWLGVSVENPRWEERIGILSDIPARIRFVSAEPLLGPVMLHEDHRVDWVIVGGESGASCRPMDLEWVRWLRDQCEASGVAFFLKQLGGHPNARAKDQAVLDGRTWTQMPAVAE